MIIPIKLPKEQKDHIIGNVRSYFENERSEEIGELAAGQLVDFMIKELAPYLYNKALEDARRVVAEKMNALEEELYSLEKR